VASGWNSNIILLLLKMPRLKKLNDWLKSIYRVTL
jgi:hypothetical protein